MCRAEFKYWNEELIYLLTYLPGISVLVNLIRMLNHQRRLQIACTL